MNTRTQARLAALSAALLLGATAPAQTDYHDQTLGYHLGRYIVLKPSGYRMVSLDVAGSLSDDRWSAVWELKAGPEWDACHGYTAQQLSQWQSERYPQGYRVSWITSAGAGNDLVYGCIMVKDGLSSSFFPDMTATTFDTVCKSAHDLGMLLVSASVHGTAADPRYTAVFAENPGKVRWGMNKNETASQYQDAFEAYVGQAWSRPALVTMSDSQRYLSVFHDDEVGTWVARHDMTKAGYESQKTTLAGQGYKPLQIMVSGLDAAARYAALFVKGTPAPLVRTTTGVAVPTFAGVDELMLGKQGASGWDPGFLQNTNARAASVAIAKDGRLVFARAYTWAINGHPITQPTTGFRLASCSKPLTSIATYHLDEKRADVSIGSKLVDLVALGTPKDSRFKDITLTHLLNHRSGYESWWGDGCTAKLPAAQTSVQNNYLAFTPGDYEVYSNGGYMMLGLMIEQKSGKTYFDYLQTNVFTPLGITRAHLITSAHQSVDARCQEMGWGGSRTLGVWGSAVLAGNPIVNGAYSISDKAIDASGGVVMSTVDYVRVLSGVFDHVVKPAVLAPATRTAMETMIEMGGRTGGFDMGILKSGGGKTYRYWEKGGLWRSAHTYVVHRSDGVSIAAFCTGPSAPPIGSINALVDGVVTWPSNDLFPSYGLPAFLKGQDAVSTAFGTACAGSNGVSSHDVIGAVEIGKVPFFHLHLGPKSSVTALTIGTSNVVWGAFPLPLLLTPFGAPNCRIYVAQDVALSMSTYSDGSAGLSLPIPSNPGLIGATVFTQFMSVDPTANALGLSFSNGVKTVVGGWY